MITAKCDKCGEDAVLKQEYDGLVSTNRINGRDLCEKCKKEWNTINQNLQTQIFKAWMNGDIKFYENSDPGTMKSAGYSNHDGGYMACPFCGELYGDYTWPVGKVFKCTGCGRNIVGH